MTDLAKKNILHRLQNALKNSTPQPYSQIKNQEAIFAQSADLLEIQFAEAFRAVGGKFVYCEHIEELNAQLSQLLQLKKWSKMACWEPYLQDFLQDLGCDFYAEAPFPLNVQASFTTCRALIARTGSVIVDSLQTRGRAISVQPSAHIILAQSKQIAANLSDVLPLLHSSSDTPSMCSIITGASRTADIEKTLVMGAHGPKEIFVFLID